MILRAIILWKNLGLAFQTDEIIAKLSLMKWVSFKKNES
jgi:hypothetical protein